jgi:hypothetical protein
MVHSGLFGAALSLILSYLHFPAHLPRYRITQSHIDIEHPMGSAGTVGLDGASVVRTRISGYAVEDSTLRSFQNQHVRSAVGLKLSIHSWNATAGGILYDKNSSGFYGAVGIFRVPQSSSQFLAIIKDALPAEHIGKGVFKVKEIGLIRIPGTGIVHTPEEREPDAGPGGGSGAELSDEERNAFDMLRRTFARHSFYFSTGEYDVSRTLQSNLLRCRSSIAARSLDCDPRFFWNRDVARPLIDAGCKDLVTPIVNMWTQSLVLDGGCDPKIPPQRPRKPYILTLIARRSRFRQGPRYSI